MKIEFGILYLIGISNHSGRIPPKKTRNHARTNEIRLELMLGYCVNIDNLDEQNTSSVGISIETPFYFVKHFVSLILQLEIATITQHK